jgi:hypothetical protein
MKWFASEPQVRDAQNAIAPPHPTVDHLYVYDLCVCVYIYIYVYYIYIYIQIYYEYVYM